MNNRKVDLEKLNSRLLLIQREVVDAKHLLAQIVSELQEQVPQACEHKTGIWRYYREGKRYCPICKADL